MPVAPVRIPSDGGAVPASVEVAGVRVPLGPHLGVSSGTALAKGKYEGHEIEAVRSALRSTDVVLELGSGVGVMATVCARIAGSRNVFTFEANPAMEEPIKGLFALNGVSPHLEICAVSQHAGTTILNLTDEFWGSSTLPVERARRTVNVPTKPFDEVREAIRPSFLVVDIEGGELELFRSAVLDGIRTIMVEVHPRLIGDAGHTEVIASLDRAGFRIDPLASTKSVLLLHRKLSGDDFRAHLRWRLSGWVIGLGLRLRG